MSASTDSSTSAAKVLVQYDEVDRGRSGAISKSVKKSSKSRRIVKSPKNLKGLKKLRRPLVWRNVYWSTDSLLIR